MSPLRRTLSDADIAGIALQFDGRRAFKLGDQGAYNAALKRGILDRVCAHMDADRYRVLSDEQLVEIASRYFTRLEFLRGDKAAYGTAYRRGILDEICAGLGNRPLRRLSDDEIFDIAAPFRTRNDFKLADFGAYVTAIRRNLIDQVCAHMEYGATGFREDLPAVLYQFRLDIPDGPTLYKVGITNRKPRQRMVTMGIQRGTVAELTHFLRFPLGRDARLAEKRLHRRHARHRYAGPPVMKNGNTEVFVVPILNS